MRFNEERESQITDGGHRSASEDLSCTGTLIVVSNRQPYRHEYVSDDGRDDTDDTDDTDEADDTTLEDQESDEDHEADGTDGSHETTGNDGNSERGSATDGGVDADSDDRSPVDSEITIDRPTGGLTAGLDPVVSQSGGTWIAWGDGDADRAVTDENDCVGVPPDDESYTLRRIWLSEEAVDGYYYGYSNRVLWPTCHEFTELVEERSGDRDWYRKVNRRFADATVDHATDGSVVWLQDYHLGLAAKMIREDVPDSVTIAQFWHIPWPQPSAFDSSPLGQELLEGLLGNDLLGFHIEEYCDAFLACVESFVPGATVEYGSQTVTHDQNETQVVATPMGVDAETYDHRSRALDGSRWESIRDRYDIPEGVAIGVGVDRLDYTKGIPGRLAAIERLLERHPSWCEKFTFIQKATPSRTDITAYADHGELVRHEVERINERFATESWRPIVYTEDFFSRADLCALYRRADTMIVSPLLDGMNLVAQEYVASSVDGDGTLVLSERAGVAELFGENVYTVDPTETDQFADSIDAALSAPELERHRQMTRLRALVFEHDLEWWMDRQFEEIERVHESGRDSASSRRNNTPSDCRESRTCEGSSDDTSSLSEGDSEQSPGVTRDDPSSYRPETSTERGTDDTDTTETGTSRTENEQRGRSYSV